MDVELGVITFVCPRLWFDYFSLPLMQAVTMRNVSGLSAYFHLLPLPSGALMLLWGGSGQGVLFSVPPEAVLIQLAL